jgi:hypothetical protein
MLLLTFNYQPRFKLQFIHLPQIGRIKENNLKLWMLGFLRWLANSKKKEKKRRLITMSIFLAKSVGINTMNKNKGSQTGWPCQ